MSGEDVIVSADHEVLLGRAARAAFGADVVFTVGPDPRDPRYTTTCWITQVGGRAVRLRLSTSSYTCEAIIDDLEVAAFVVDDQMSTGDRYDYLVRLATPLRAFAAGEGRVEERRTWFLRRRRRVFVVGRGDQRWELGRFRCRIPFPDDC